jgi:predicted DNA-binding transcriptional regulator YafY
MKIKASCLDKANFSKDVVSFAPKYEKLPKEVGLKILNAITKNKKITFKYKKSKDDITSRSVNPIKIFIDSTSGSWYLVGSDDKDNLVKKFALSKIKNFKESDIVFSTSDDVQKEADSIKTVWHSSNHKTHNIRLYIVKEAAHYFNYIKLHHTQIIENIDFDSGIEISCRITNKMEILPAIKSWIPHIYVLEPKWLRDEIMNNIEKYKEFQENMDI